MADSLILKGVKDVRKHTGSDLLFRFPKGRGDAQHSLKAWWYAAGVSTQYVKASVFDATTTNGKVKLAVTTSPSSQIRIDFDGAAFTVNSFIAPSNVDYVGVFTEDFELIEYYAMPKQSGGKVAKGTFAGAPGYPAAAPSPAPAASSVVPTRAPRSRKSA